MSIDSIGPIAGPLRITPPTAPAGVEPPISPMSAPATKARPAPVRITPATSSRPVTSSIATPNSVMSASLSALSLSGRLAEMVATRSATSSVSVW